MDNFQNGSGCRGLSAGSGFPNRINCQSRVIGTDSNDSLHRQFLILGRERNKITYKLLSLLPQIYKQKIYQKHGYATIYEYAGKLAGLSHSVVEKALKLEEKLKDKPNLQKAIETQGIHKVSIVASIATPENEKMFADKVENMSKPALQQFSKELRGKIQTTWQIEMDSEMMKMFLKLKEKVGRDLSNKEAMRRMLVRMATIENGCVGNTAKRTDKEVFELSLAMMAKNEKSQAEAKTLLKIPGEKVRSEGGEQDSNLQNSIKIRSTVLEKSERNSLEISTPVIKKGQNTNLDSSSVLPPKITRYIPAAQKRKILASTNGQCSHKNCNAPAQIFHHQIRFSQNPNHTSIIPLCKIHHEFAHNGITEQPKQADALYRKYRQNALL